MKIEVKYFAALRESAGKSSEIIDFEGQTIEDVYQALNEKYSFSVERSHLKVALNEEYANFEDRISSGDIVVFIPPVAGG
jgi:molybdopterin converting factor subunit 1